MASVEELKRESRVTGWDHKFDLSAQISTVQFATIEDVMYAGCSKLGCFAGVRTGEDGRYTCRKCETTANRCVYRYRVRVVLRGEQEEGEEVLATMFDRVGAEVVGISAEALRRLGGEWEERVRSLQGRWYMFTLTRNKRDLRAAEGYIAEGVKPCKRPECDID